MQPREPVPVLRSGSSSYPLFIGVTTTTTDHYSSTHNPVTDAFCEGCGDWIVDPPALNDSPFYTCSSCARAKKAIGTKRKRHKNEV